MDFASSSVSSVMASLINVSLAPGEGGVQYAFVIIDDRTRHTWVCFLEKPRDVLKAFTRWFKEVDRYGGLLDILVAGPGLVVVQDELRRHLENFGISYFPAEEKKLSKHAVVLLETLCTDTARIMYLMSLPPALWPEILRACVYIVNVSPQIRDPPDVHAPDRKYVTPAELWNGFTPSVAHLRALGSTVWAPVYGTPSGELEIGILVGHGTTKEGEDAYRVWGEKRGIRVVQASKAVVDESTTFKWPGDHQDLYGITNSFVVRN
ncbi:hypothetical protein IAT38_007337 [Cryptococcus sp. DSM 104549]